ncbi:S41 family peptidase [Streptacidiphilus fuscans]|uniref:Tricorn protease homolog n=1 Tax=Streptacidiphilus fuscans TaxID=2789292 RepID=A0A931BA08_9ACTN|nr:S41 family peptidase [Streptacidiphilus fuscans]MBF9073299.1 PDZ domain-containing protein [Streptacidiphilus fuscans]
MSGGIDGGGRPYLRHPHLARNLLTFVADDDVWLADLDAAATGRAQARRLTSDRVPVQHPRLSPDARRVAWTSTRDSGGGAGQTARREAYAASVDGGAVTRLTYWGDTLTAVRGWLSASEVLVLGRPSQHPTMRTWAYAVPLDAPARRLPYGPAGDLALAADGAALVGTPLYREPAWWKRYRGGMGGRIWQAPQGRVSQSQAPQGQAPESQAQQGGEFAEFLAEVGPHLVNPMWVGDRVAFLSDHEGVGALYSTSRDGSDLRRHTDHGGHYARHATTDGTRVVYQCAGELWLLESLGSPESVPVRLDVVLDGTPSGREPRTVTAQDALEGFSLDATGGTVIATVRGSVQRVPVGDAPAHELLAAPGVRGRLAVELPDATAVLCVTDAGGEDGLELLPVFGAAPVGQLNTQPQPQPQPQPQQPRRLAVGELGRVQELTVAPDGRHCAVAADDGRVLLVEFGSGTVTELASTANGAPAGLVFSPDSALLAWSQLWSPSDGSTPANGSSVRLARVGDRRIFEVTGDRFNDTCPAFTQDGLHLAFLSNRTFDPHYDAQQFDMAFLPTVRPYLATLSADTLSPFGPGPAEGTVTAPALDPAMDLELDLEGMADRVVAFPVAAGDLAQLRAVRGGVVWTETTGGAGNLGESTAGSGTPGRRTALARFDLSWGVATVVHEDVDAYAVSADGSRIAVRSGPSLAMLDLTGQAQAEVPLDQVRVTCDPVAEWRQMYDEASRLMRDNFWSADLCGVDWAAERERYRPLLDRLGSYDDFVDLLWELHGALGASHAYVLPRPEVAPTAPVALSAPSAPTRHVGAPAFLGADLSAHGDGTWRIDRLLPGESSVAAARSPLLAPGLRVQPGERIAEVDGRPVDPHRGPAPQLLGKADQPVELTLRGANGDRRIVVLPTGSEAVLRYHDLIRTRRAEVRRLSGGRLGYLHIPDMMSRGWAEFHRDLRAELACEGLVVDFRENSGGHISPLVVERLTRRVIGWDVSRRGTPASYPSGSPLGPVVVLADEQTGSDGEMAVHALQAAHGLTVVGVRTWGGVYGMDDPITLVDGTRVTHPKHAFWFEGPGFALEGDGVTPDLEVGITPQDWAAGRDPQLEAAVGRALADLKDGRSASPSAPTGRADEGGTGRDRNGSAR